MEGKKSKKGKIAMLSQNFKTLDNFSMIGKNCQDFSAAAFWKWVKMLRLKEYIVKKWRPMVIRVR